MQASETGISSQQSYSFTLHSSSSVAVSLTGLTRDFDCRVGTTSCTNRWGKADDSWSGTLAAGTHTVVVYPYGSGGPGDYTLTIAVNDVSLVSVVSAFGAPDTEDDDVCKDEDGNEITCPTPDEILVVIAEDPGPPLEPEGTTPPETDPPDGTPDPGDGGGGGGGGGTPLASWVTPSMQTQLATAATDATAKATSCSVTPPSGVPYNAYAALTAAQIVFEGDGCSIGLPAHVDSIPGTTIHICPRFFDRSAHRRSRVIMHEGLHLAGLNHADFPPFEDGDATGMNDAITSSCGYSP